MRQTLIIDIPEGSTQIPPGAYLLVQVDTKRSGTRTYKDPGEPWILAPPEHYAVSTEAETPVYTAPRFTCLGDLTDLLHEKGYPYEVLVDVKEFRRLWEMAPPASRGIRDSDHRPCFYIMGCGVMPKDWPDLSKRPTLLDLSSTAEVASGGR